ncbi:MAG: erv26 super protein [Cirrosporium novae-zelandiae]|nr:MAG: erv26 super protein [Cirrosporium novae-zelandiae]
MIILSLLGYLGLGLGFAFLTLAIASGLYYLSELVEEHTVLAKRALLRLIYAVIVIQVLLVVVDGFPFLLSALSIGSHVVYAGNLRRFPFVQLGDPLFICSCVLVLLNHYLWFRHFSHPPSFPSHNPAGYPSSSLPTFTEIASYFGICVWLVPFALFVSLSAGDNVLPTMTGGGGPDGVGIGGDAGSMLPGSTAGMRKGGRQGLIKAVAGGAKEWVGEIGVGMGWTQPRRLRRDL